jgi:hypothetical protein
MTPTLKDCFNSDSEGIGVSTKFKLNWTHKENPKLNFELEIDFKVSRPWISDKILYFFYIPANEHATDVCYRIMKDYKKYYKSFGITESRRIEMYGGSIKLGVDSPVLHDELYFYVENPIDDKQTFSKNTPLNNLAEELGITVYFREEEYRKERSKSMKLLAFISHDSRDKELIARPIAQELTSKLYNIWFDEYSLKIGDNLRESIEKGIKESNKCVLVLTPNFLSNPGWTKKEFDSIFTKELIKKENLILPIWYNVSAQDIYEYSPSLANTVALHWPEKSKMAANEYKRAIESICSEIIKQLNKNVV